MQLKIYADLQTKRFTKSTLTQDKVKQTLHMSGYDELFRGPDSQKML